MKNKNENIGSMKRRKFLKLALAAAAGGPALLSEANSLPRAIAKSNRLIHRHEEPSMKYQKLGDTNFMSSRLVFGCGAALVGGKAVRLLDRAFEAGVNHFDVGSDCR